MEVLTLRGNLSCDPALSSALPGGRAVYSKIESFDLAERLQQQMLKCTHAKTPGAPSRVLERKPSVVHQLRERRSRPP